MFAMHLHPECFKDLKSTITESNNTNNTTKTQTKQQEWKVTLPFITLLPVQEKTLQLHYITVIVLGALQV